MEPLPHSKAGNAMWTNTFEAELEMQRRLGAIERKAATAWTLQPAPGERSSWFSQVTGAVGGLLMRIGSRFTAEYVTSTGGQHLRARRVLPGAYDVCTDAHARR